MGAKVRVNWGPLGEGRTTKFWAVCNSNSNFLYVLAPDHSTALHIAYSANHVHEMGSRKDASYPYVEEIKKPLDGGIVMNWNSIEMAMASGEQGTVHVDNGRLLIGDKVFTK